MGGPSCTTCGLERPPTWERCRGSRDRALGDQQRRGRRRAGLAQAANGRLRSRAFLYDPITATVVDLNDRIPAASGSVLTAALDINEAEQIVGEGVVGGRTQAFLLNP